MQNIDEFIETRFLRKFSKSDLEKSKIEYENLKAFGANENIFKTQQSITDETLYYLRLKTQYHLQNALDAMLISQDPNTSESLDEGNIGTAGRIAKLLISGSITDDSEMGSGRFMKPPRLAKFPNTENSRIPITKRITITSNCSHHFLPFSTSFAENSFAIVSYIPFKFVLGISKLQRLADFVSRRFWLQEDLTKELYKEISSAAETPDVYVGLFNLKHTCEWLRGARNCEGGFTSEYYGGKFKDFELRNSILSGIK